ncbi:hypothetical protein GEV33_002481 [Tenebrio molitor]|jgi:hypothetical protein|uniref:Uncharacterized protein n=1 Tax=Tenebrio molitor TaxID=7067 RepID=A0A8J6LFZ9_TENMO|nr:hypothetical protein GEV33_002481 [Tenebrio molitor]
MRRAVVPGVSGGEPKFTVYGEVSVWDFLHGGEPQLAMARVIGGRDGVSFGEVRACPEEQYPGARPRIAAVYSGTPDTDGTAESSEHNWRLRPPGGEPNGRGTKDERT